MATKNAYTANDIYTYAQDQGWLNSDGKIKDVTSGKAMYADAQRYGVTGSQIDDALGMDAGTADGWIKAQGLGALGAAANDPLPPTANPSTTPSTTPGTTTPPATDTGPAATVDQVNAASRTGAATTPTATAAPAATPTYTGNPNLPDWATNPSQAVGALQSMAGQMKGPTSFAVNDNMLTSSQLMKLLSQDNPYITRARAKSAEYSAARGLQNSSIGAGAGEAAAIDAALPIAQSDAQAYFEGGMADFQNANQFIRDENSFGREGALAALNQGFNLARDDAGYRFQAGESAAGRSHQTSERLGTQAWQSGENLMDRSHQTSERLGSQAWKTGESALDRAQQTNITNLQEEGADRRQGRQITATERLTRAGWAHDDQSNEAQRTWQTGENQTQRAWQTGENQTQRDFTSGENRVQREWQSGENAAGHQTQRDIANLQESGANTRSERQTNAGLFELYMNSWQRLTTDPNLTSEQKSVEIDKMASWFFDEALPAWKSGFTDPASWPRPKDSATSSTKPADTAANDPAIPSYGESSTGTGRP